MNLGSYVQNPVVGTVGRQDKCDNLPLKELQSCNHMSTCPYLLDLAVSDFVIHKVSK